MTGRKNQILIHYYLRGRHCHLTDILLKQGASGQVQCAISEFICFHVIFANNYYHSVYTVKCV